MTKADVKLIYAIHRHHFNGEAKLPNDINAAFLLFFKYFGPVSPAYQASALARITAKKAIFGTFLILVQL
jgi:hypothetical protein